MIITSIFKKLVQCVAIITTRAPVGKELLAKGIPLNLVSTGNKLSGKDRFKKYLKKIGSGEHTSREMTREESGEALDLMLSGQATPAQIGGFMIAHRMRRPEPQELAGMLDTYRKFGPKLQTLDGHSPPICFGMPFDGRKRTAPIYPLTTLVLLSHKQPVVLQGGQRMPIKYGITTVELFQALGLQLTELAINKVQEGFEKNKFALIHQPDHFLLAESLINYRDEIGKRPPIASMELIWTAHQGKHLLISGFVHPPTEARAWKALEIFGEEDVVTVKGLEGGTDLPISRPCITARVKNQIHERLILHPRDYQCYGKDNEWNGIDEWKTNAFQALDNKGPYKQALIWNAGTYLFFSGRSLTLEEGLSKAESSIASGLAKIELEKLINWRNQLCK